MSPWHVDYLRQIKRMPMKIMGHPTGNMFVRALIESACSKGILKVFTPLLPTAEAIGSKFPARVLNRYKRRSYAITDDLIHRHPFRETVRLLTAKAGLARLNRHESGQASLMKYTKNWTVNSPESCRIRGTHIHCMKTAP